MNTQMQLGDHLIIDLSGCNREQLLNGDASRDLFFNTVRAAGLTIVSEGFYKFSPHGFTCFLLLAESHASLHAWPEYGYCAIDLFTCNVGLDLTPLVEVSQPVTGQRFRFEPGSFDQFVSIGVWPQLLFWTPLCWVTGLLGSLVASRVLARR